MNYRNQSGATIPQNNASDYYTGTSGKEYFWQPAVRRTRAGQAHASLAIARDLRPAGTIVDFGCGTGAILANLNCRERIGVEINEEAIPAAQANGIRVYRSVEDISSGIADAVIMHHSLEHVSEPASILKECYRILRENGQLIIVVPAENPRHRRFARWHQDPNRHLFSWTPLSLGNLMTVVGFSVQTAFARVPDFFGRYERVVRRLPGGRYLASQYRAWWKGYAEVVCIAEKPCSAGALGGSDVTPGPES